MENKRELSFSLWYLIIPVFFGLTIWTVYWMELETGWYLNHLGIYPRHIKGLPGIVLSPFIHSSVEHLYHNTIPLMVLSTALFYFYRAIAWKVMWWGLVLSGVLTWIFARPAWHIGASGVIYMLVTFIFFKGLFAGNYRLMALSLLVVFLYGSMVWYVLPVDDKISWEGHLGGAIAGFVLSLFFKKEVLQPVRYRWEQEDYKAEEDPFMRHFDEEGNFIEELPEDRSELEDEENRELKVTYHYRERGSKGEDG
ncbi:rhomboid family intramembrane serine protease [Robertkochia flava]|uniref:rhomboid family intramembrane serine protease n=1 Tax=Robertkochia flava TaxID=3447986 RepID=UPI001CCE6615|nr:rhomboid family intramembrane serine protease [Robertkochia marina]